MPVVRVAAGCVESMVLRRCQRFTGTLLSRMLNAMEHVHDAGPVSRMQSSMDVDFVLEMQRLVVARGLVRRAVARLTGGSEVAAA